MSKRHNLRRKEVRGLTLLELMVGMTIGLVVSTAAVGTLVFMQSSGRINGETSRMQQDATLVFNLMGQYIRSSGSVGLTESTGGGISLTPTSDFNGVANNGIVLDGLSTTEFRTAISLPKSIPGVNDLQYDCLGREVSGPSLVTHFELNGSELRCVGLRNGETKSATGVTPQPVIANVAQFVIHYGVRPVNATTLQYLPFSTAINWADVVALRVCLVLTSQGPVEDFHALYRDTPSLPFTDCGATGSTAIDRSTIVNDPNRRMYRMYRQVFTVRPASL